MCAVSRDREPLGRENDAKWVGICFRNSRRVGIRRWFFFFFFFFILLLKQVQGISTWILLPISNCFKALRKTRNTTKKRHVLKLQCGQCHLCLKCLRRSHLPSRVASCFAFLRREQSVEWKLGKMQCLTGGYIQGEERALWKSHLQRAVPPWREAASPQPSRRKTDPCPGPAPLLSTIASSFHFWSPAGSQRTQGTSQGGDRCPSPSTAGADGCGQHSEAIASIQHTARWTEDGSLGVQGPGIWQASGSSAPGNPAQPALPACMRRIRRTVWDRTGCSAACGLLECLAVKGRKRTLHWIIPCWLQYS